MGKILDAFLDDQLHVNAVTAKRTRHHQYLCEQIEILHNKLAEKLNDEDKALLQKFADTYFDESCCDAHSYFVRGYRLGVLMTMEVFEGQDSFLGHLSMIFDAKWQNFCVRKIPIPMLV